MYYAKGYVDYVEQKTTRNGKGYTTFQLSEPNGTDSEGKKMYKRNHFKMWKPNTLSNGDYIELKGEIYEYKDSENKTQTDKVCNMVDIISKGKQTDEKNYGKATSEEEYDFDSIPF